MEILTCWLLEHRWSVTCIQFPSTDRPVWARGRCRISPPRFLAECCKRQLNQVSLVLLYFSDLCWVCLSVFSCTVLFVSISQVIGCGDRLQNDLCCVGWGVKLYSNQTCLYKISFIYYCSVDLCCLRIMSAIMCWFYPCDTMLVHY